MRSAYAKRNSRSAPGSAMVAWAALAFLGCGGTTVGRTSTNGNPDGPDGSSNAGGTTSSTGGRPSTGGVPGCAGALCKPTSCAPGFRAVTLPGACCATCVNDCSTVDCAFPLCPPGVMTYTPPGQCCPVCGPDCSLVDCAPPKCPPGSKNVPSPNQCCGTCTPVTGDASVPVCNPGIDAFLKVPLFNGTSCVTSQDCVIVQLGFQCKLDCGTAVSVASAKDLMSLAQKFSATNCTGCPQTNVACPPVYYTAECQNVVPDGGVGQCVRVP